MENDIYRRTIVPCKDSEDGETPTILWVTKEANGFGIFLTGYNVAWGTLLKWFNIHQRDDAIEYGVNEAEQRLFDHFERKEKKAA